MNQFVALGYSVFERRRPARVKKTPQDKKIEPGSDSVIPDLALDL
jgi:hypothetical protein